MDVISNQELFDERQEQFAKELVQTLKRTLEEHSLDEQTVYDLTDSLTFGVSALLDGSALSGDLDDPTVAYLAFREKEESLDSIITSPIGSYLHEVATGIVEEEFEL